ncbi:DNA polymerase [Bradyrhizobium sp. Ash2021]|uniref:DNA polymerase n=1 Tax=Bradyrhizobium sp. Ash2021 TaxID=2954771 RepID=UPI0028155FF7|nr:DNA polymerase [Bradyrhizobium sp. Ash2021]WMT76066.1 DNA polymerase [Bradyrhizobium sp. Ash2021]
MRTKFKNIVVCDFEYEVAPGDLPNPLCMVAYVLDENCQHVRTIRLWRGEFGYAPPFDIGSDTLVVAYSAWAEMTCFKVLGWNFPKYIFDQHTAYLAASNILLPYSPDEARIKPRKRLSDACRMYGIEGWEGIDKGDISESIGNGTWREKYIEQEVFDYCEEDVRASKRLLRAQLRGTDYYEPASVPKVLHWSEYSAKAIALIQARGMPIDMVLWNLVQENKADVIADLIRRFDPSHGSPHRIFSDEGEWEYVRFAEWLAYAGVPAWPRLESGQLDVSADAFGLMSHVPGIEGLYALRDSLGFISKARLPIGRDGRNRPSLFPFGTSTGRNAHAKSPYNAHAGMRSFMRFPAGSVGFYLDWRSQEVGIAAARSDDPMLKADYLAGDIYHALAVMCGLADDPDPVRWKKANRAVRDRMKPLQLGINYGMGVPSLARGLNRHPLIASEIIQLHKRRYPRFWRWRADTVTAAMLDRRIESEFGWPLRISHSPNRRTLYNFPMQSGGAEMLRLATVRLVEAGIVPIMLIHDGILFEDTGPEKIEHAIEIMSKAGREVCGGLEIGVELDKRIDGGERYVDSRPMALKMWSTIMNTVEAIGALPKKRGVA